MSLSFKQPLTAPEFIGASNNIVSVSKFGTVAASLSYIGSKNYILIVDQNSAENFTVPSNVTLFPAGGLLSGTITINGFIVLEPRIKIFNGATLTLGTNVIKICPEWWGAVGDGITNDAVAVNSSFGFSSKIIEINSMYAVGSAGWVGVAMTSKSDNIVRGTKKGAGFKFLATPSQGAILRGGIYFNSCTNCIVENLEINQNAIPAFGINFYSSTYCIARNNEIYGSADASYGGIITTNGQYNLFDGMVTHDLGAGLYLGNSNTGYIEKNVKAINNISYDTLSDGIVILAENALISHNISKNCYSGIIIAGDVLEKSKNVVVSNNVCESNNAHGIQIDCTNSAVIKNIHIINNICKENDGSGIYSYALEDSFITGNTCYDNNYDDSGTADGISLGDYPSSANVLITDNIVYDTRVGAARTQNNGISITSTGSGNNNVIVSKNIAFNNKAFGIVTVNVGAGTNTNVIVTDNISHSNATNIGIQGSISEGIIIGDNITYGGGTIDIRTDFPCIKHDNIAPTMVAYGITFTPGDTTPSVKKGDYFSTNDGAPNTITDFDDGYEGQVFTLYFYTVNTTITHGTNILTKSLANDNPAQYHVRQYKKIGTKWIEI